jgi:two-component SAPR family response regulator
MLRIWLFGSLCIADDSTGDHGTPISGRCGSLLAYLALGRGRYFNRAELLDALWTERMASMTAGSFNTALWRLRRMIERPPFRHGELIGSDRRGAICMSRSEAVWLDVEEFGQRIASGLDRPIEQIGDAEIEDLRAGVALYKSDILMELTDDWALREREKHRRHYLNALGRLMQVYTIRREYGEAIGYAQKILECDALREDLHRELMQLFVLSGQRAQALRQFELCREMLRRELAIQPMRETLALYRQIADNAIGGDHATPRAMQAPLRMEYGPMTSPAAAEVRTDHGAGAYIASARRYLAAADAQLELSLQQIDS